MLALECRAHGRSELAGRLWPDVREDSARASLRNAFAQLRGVLGQQADSVVRTELGEAIAIAHSVDTDIAGVDRQRHGRHGRVPRPPRSRCRACETRAPCSSPKAGTSSARDETHAWDETRSEVRRGDFFRFAPRKRACADPQPVSSEVVHSRSLSGVCRRARIDRKAGAGLMSCSVRSDRCRHPLLTVGSFPSWNVGDYGIAVNSYCRCSM
jgi:hypothetical protein